MANLIKKLKGIDANKAYGPFDGNLTQAQRIDIERVQKRALRIIVPEYEYNRALQECGLKTLQQRRDDLCVRLIEQTSEPSYKQGRRGCCVFRGAENRIFPTNTFFSDTDNS